MVDVCPHCVAVRARAEGPDFEMFGRMFPDAGEGPVLLEQPGHAPAR
jgi:hypothetical protein